MASTNGRRNIMLVNAALDIGGAEVVIANLCRHINSDLFKLTVCLLRNTGRIGDELAGEGHEIICLGNGSRSADYLNGLKLLNLCRQLRIDLVNSHCRGAFLDCSFCKALSPGLKFIHTFHYGNFPHAKFRYRVMDSVASRMADKMVSVGYEQSKTIKFEYGIASHRIDTIWNGIDYQAAPDRATLSGVPRDGRVIIGTIANLIEQKGIGYLLDTAALLKSRRNDFLFAVVGDGPLREGLERRTGEMGLADVVFFPGKVSNAAARALPFFDIFFQPSIWEAMSIVIIEAMACGKPIVATAVGDNPIMIGDGSNGLLVKSRDPAGMASALEKLIVSGELRARFGRRSREMFEMSFSAEKMAGRYEQIYREVLEI